MPLMNLYFLFPMIIGLEEPDISMISEVPDSQLCSCLITSLLSLD